eukprot:6336083-Amphidinium_carterae.1
MLAPHTRLSVGIRSLLRPLCPSIELPYTVVYRLSIWQRRKIAGKVGQEGKKPPGMKKPWK